jgi:hypothetical protein
MLNFTSRQNIDCRGRHSFTGRAGNVLNPWCRWWPRASVGNTLWPSTAITSAGSQYYSNTTGFDPSAVSAQKWTVEINRNLRAYNNGTTQSVYFSWGQYSTANNLVIRALSSATPATSAQLDFYFSTGTTAGGSTSNYGGQNLTTTKAPVNWSQAIVEIDFTVPQITVYYDGSTTAGSSNGNVEVLNHANYPSYFPSSAQYFVTGQSAQKLYVGALNASGSPANFSDANLLPCRLWPKAVVQDQGTSIVGTLWNGGIPLLYSQLPAALKAGGAETCKFAWDFQTATTVADQTGNGFTLTGQKASGSFTTNNLVTRNVEQSPFKVAGRPLTMWYAPILNPTGINGQPAFQTDGLHCLQYAMPGIAANDAAGDAFVVANITSLPATTDAMFFWTACRNGTPIASLQHGVLHMLEKATYNASPGTGQTSTNNGGTSPWYRQLFQLANESLLTDGQFLSNGDHLSGYTLATSTNYLLNARAYGTGNDASFAFRCNEQDETVDTHWETNGTVPARNCWMKSTGSLDTFVLGALNYWDGTSTPNGGGFHDITQSIFSGLIAEVAVFGSSNVGNVSAGKAALPVGLARLVESGLKTRYGT